jgi:hypothetical protein
VNTFRYEKPPGATIARLLLRVAFHTRAPAVVIHFMPELPVIPGISPARNTFSRTADVLYRIGSYHPWNAQ